MISAWAVEDLFYDGLNPLPSDITEERMHYLDMVKDAEKVILSVDYVDDGSGYYGENKKRIDDYFAKARQAGCIPYAALADRELDELNTIEGLQPV